MLKKFKNFVGIFVLTIGSAVAQVNDKVYDLESVTVRPDCKNIIGYYPSWQQYKRNGLMVPENLDYSKYTIMNYSFFQPDSLGNIFGTDAWGDSILLRGKYDWGAPIQPTYIPHTSVIDYCHVWGVRMMVSIGGWTLSDRFPKLAADPALRAKFASSCVQALRLYNFDGIDIDWEYPGYEEHKGGPADKENYTLFMKAIRDSIDTYGRKIGFKFYLTAAFGANLGQMENIEWKKLDKFMDYFNMMTYDFNGTWSEDANHDSPLYNPAKGTQASYDACYKLITEKYGIAPEKINMGVPFYGRSLLGTDKSKIALHSTDHGKAEDEKTFVPDDGGVSYFNVLLQMKHFDKFWDDVAQVPYLIGKKRNTFVSFDDEKAIQLKAEYVNQKKAAGVIIWDITNDYVERQEGSGTMKGTPLAKVLVDVLKPCPLRPIKKKTDFYNVVPNQSKDEDDEEGEEDSSPKEEKKVVMTMVNNAIATNASLDILGNVKDAFSNKRIDAKVKFVRLPDLTEKGRFSTDSASGFKISLSRGYKYALIAEASGFVTKRDTLDATEVTVKEEVEHNVALERNPLLIISGNVFDHISKSTVEAEVSLLKKSDHSVIQTMHVTATTGYKFILKPGTEYIVVAKSIGYLADEEFYNLEGAKYDEKVKDFYLEALKKDVKFTAKNISFESGNAVLTNSSHDALERLEDILKDSPNVMIEVSGHTDNVGSEENNLALSQSRAQSVVDYLINKGISSSRLTAKGYGESRPIATNKTPRGKSKNRRVEVKIIDVK